MVLSAIVDFDDVERQETLPRLAWSLRLRHRRATLKAGPGVEITTGTCSEGIWASEELDLRSFAWPERRAGVHFFGTAAVRISPTEFLFFPSTHTLEGLYLVVAHDGSSVTVTNSPIWAMREAGMPSLNTKETSSFIESVRSTTSGLLGYKRLLLDTPSASLIRIIYTPFVVDTEAGVFAEEPVGFARDVSPLTFAGYKDLLLSTLRLARRNATAPDRQQRYKRLYSTMSSGYDSTACAALAKELGFTEVLSLDTSRGGVNDSGRVAAGQMGHTMRLYPRPGNGLEFRSETTPDYFIHIESIREQMGKSYAEFIGFPANYGDLIFDPFAPVLPGSILLTGFHAGPMWFPDSKSGPWIRRADASGTGLTEFRLRVGFVHIPVAFIHCLRWRSIKQLTNSPEMRPFHWGHPYNKPIARRLGEEAGAERKSFGVKKRAANVMVLLRSEGFMPSYEEVAARYD
jgi:hypothetical protein